MSCAQDRNNLMAKLLGIAIVLHRMSCIVTDGPAVCGAYGRQIQSWKCTCGLSHWLFVSNGYKC